MVAHMPNTILRKDYQESSWQILKTSLYFSLEADATTVVSQLHLQRSTASINNSPLVLQGVGLQLQEVKVDGVVQSDDDYEIDATSLTLRTLPDTCVLSIETLINPKANLALEGLYQSSGNFCTQCEAEGFRKITYYLDRPDVLSVFDVAIEADAEACPVVLSNGNLVSSDILDSGRHVTHWHDPHPKPCYLFALVAGKLSVIEDTFVTASGQSVLLQIYVQAHNVMLCDYAMGALKRSMLWDEQMYGFEYDLERFMIVAVDDFTMGAMENKGLNIFNSRYVLADINTATDADFLGVEAVIAHEYFHNWTGNRITCKDWFQLSLKEGLTVFRDQCFSSDMHSATVKRIADVRLLRARQFAEDASPMAHPIRPDSFIEINNFYTVTVYEKGAEVIRMLHTLLGEKSWRAGMDEYVRRHDGTATTCDAFIDAMQSVTSIELEQFRLWYSQAGTPRVSVQEQYDEQAHRYTLRIEQSNPDTPGQCNKPALHLPIRMGLLDASGKPIALQARDVEGATADIQDNKSILLNVTSQAQTFVFEGIAQKPVASLLRGFSAPVKLEHNLTDEELGLLVAHDSDAFNRWEALQRLATRAVMAQLDNTNVDKKLTHLNLALSTLLSDASLEPAFKADALQFPSIDTIAEELDQVDYQRLGHASEAVQIGFAKHSQARLLDLVARQSDIQASVLDDNAMGARRLANAALNLLSLLPETLWLRTARAQFVNANNMTDKLAALSCLCHTHSDFRDQSLQEFFDLSLDNKLVLDKWFAIQASSRREQVLDDVLALFEHEQFDNRNPNRVRALVASFALNNPVAFHASDGRGYAFVAQRVIELDAINPQVAAALVKSLTRWDRLVNSSQHLMREQLVSIMKIKPLSADVYELVSKSLAER